MKARQSVISLNEFAEAMLKAGGGFAERVQDFTERFGGANDDVLAVLAQAAHFCWFEVEYERDLMEICRAIGSGKPTSLFLCGQLTVGRWTEMNTYVIGVQRWLGVDLPSPGGLNQAKIEEIQQWMGERNAAREALAELFLCKLIPSLLDSSFSKLGGNVAPDRGGYADFSQWYARPDGSPYRADGEHAEKCRRRLRQEMARAPQATDELLAGFDRPTQPPCMHRFSRYLDIRLTSIGALKWRGSLPPDEVPAKKWKSFWDDKVIPGLKAWLDDRRPEGKLASRLHQALGPATGQKKAILRDLFLADPEERMGGTQFFSWVRDKAKEQGITAGATFECAANAQ